MPMIRLAGVALVATLATNLPAAAQSPVPDLFKGRLAIAQSRLAINLVQQLATPKKAMVIVSPASVAGAAAALDLGASTLLRSSLHTLLGFRKDADAVADLARLRDAVQRLTADARPGGPLTFANSIIFNDGIALYPGVALAFKQAGVDHAILNFAAPETADKVNAGIRERTAGLIPEMLDRAPVSGNLLVLNALHFKDRWKTPFDRADTRPESFKPVGGRSITVSTMHLPQGRYLFRQDARFVGIELPYADPRFSMVIVTTRGERPAAAAAFLSVGDWLTGKGFAEASGELALPYFDASGREDLTQVLDLLGLRAARLAPDALSGFSAYPARITRVMQRVELRLNEEGTEAAAVTAVMVERGVDSNYVRMVVDKPFVFGLRDAATGLVLVAGYVGQPAIQATAGR